MMNTPATKEAFLKFVDGFGDLGVVSPRTADNILLVVSAIKNYIPEELPATEWDISTIVGAFQLDENLTENTAKTYRSRFKSAVDKFIDVTEGKELKQVAKRKSPAKINVQDEDGVKTFSLPIPLRENLIVAIENLPRDLSEEEAERIATIIKSFAIRQ
ncbi:hypothetical protein [Morganella morganii]|uniref:hypothetical protein n=1 Tax=Morganella morganii TaxID=582 RepID=UPI0021D0A5DC|nr:hypothetical protein [Morganella morganii]